MKISLLRLMREYSLYSNGKTTFIARLTSVLLLSVLFVLCIILILYSFTQKILFSAMISSVIFSYCAVFIRISLIKKYSALLLSSKREYYTKKKLEVISKLSNNALDHLIEKVALQHLNGEKLHSNGILYLGGVPIINLLELEGSVCDTKKLDNFIELGYCKLAVVCASDKVSEFEKKYTDKITLFITESQLFDLMPNIEILPPQKEKTDIKAVLNRKTAKLWLKIAWIVTILGVVSGKIGLFGGIGLVFVLLSVATNVYCIIKAR